MEKKSSNKNMILVIALGVVVAILAIAVVYFYLQYQKIKKNPNIVAKQETDQLVEQVSKLIDLPKDETPTVATILDKEKLKDQPFFANAQNGDKILIYTKAKKAITAKRTAKTEDDLLELADLEVESKLYFDDKKTSFVTIEKSEFGDFSLPNVNVPIDDF
jgi:hypothetical protein